ncbi:hypothetical protein FM107_08610 [Sphingobacterium sp. JB170]|nr:hypothetical protein FM107_08610 [Sphingobacterium sp. JB170]
MEILFLLIKNGVSSFIGYLVVWQPISILEEGNKMAILDGQQ